MKINTSLEAQECDDEELRCMFLETAFKNFDNLLVTLLKFGGSNESRDLIEELGRELKDVKPDFREWREEIQRVRRKGREHG